MKGGRQHHGFERPSVCVILESEEALVLSLVYHNVLRFSLLLLLVVSPFQSLSDLADGWLEPAF